MSLGWDAASDYDRYSARRERDLEKFPKCAWCGEPITDDHCYEINGDLVHTDCATDYLDENCKVDTDNYID